MMNNKQLELFADELEQAKERKRLARSAAKNLIVEFQIPQGNNLNFLLSAARARSNEEALMEWILVNTPETEYLNTEMYARLADKLRRIFLEVGNGTLH